MGSRSNLTKDFSRTIAANRNSSLFTKAVFFIFLTSFAIRLAVIFIMRYNIYPSVWEFDAMALNLLAKKGYVYNYLSADCRMIGYPLYPYLSAGIHFITNRNYFIFEVSQVFIAALAVFPLTSVIKKIFGINTSLAAGLLYCFHPGLIIYSCKLHELTLAGFLIITVMYMLIVVKTAMGKVFAGFLIGLGTLLRPEFILFLPSFLVYEMSSRQRTRKTIYNFAIILITASLFILPWIYRGYRLYHRFIFISTSSTEHFWRGNNVNATGGALTEDHRDMFSAADANFKLRIYSLDEIGRYDFFRDAAFSYIKSHPADFLKRTVKKFIYFWSFSPQTGTEYPFQWFLIYIVFYVILAFGFAMGIWAILRNRHTLVFPDIILLMFFCLAVSAAHSLYYVEMRHRWMIEPILLAISSYGFVSIKRALPFLRRAQNDQ